jgi:hypothetical protein
VTVRIVDWPAPAPKRRESAGVCYRQFTRHRRGITIVAGLWFLALAITQIMLIDDGVRRRQIEEPDRQRTRI